MRWGGIGGGREIMVPGLYLGLHPKIFLKLGLKMKA
jgi:hypothetical protein